MKTFGAWERWTSPESFEVEPVNFDCETGVVLYTHPNHRGDSIFIDRSVCLEDIRDWDDEVDSLVLKNVPAVKLCEDPERFGLGPCFYFDHDCPDTQEHGFRRNSATYLEIDFGF